MQVNSQNKTVQERNTRMLTYDTAGQSAEDMVRELRDGARISEINAAYYRGAIEMVVLGHSTARFVIRLGTSLLWKLDDESILMMDMPIEAKVYKPEGGRNE